MAELQYSDEALNVKSAFYKVKTLLYVEGDDDVLFWHEIFSQIPNASVEIEPVGGSDELDEYIAKIASGHVDAIAARDSDFLAFTSGMVKASRVIYTYGYSIENSLYTADAVASLVKLWCKTTKVLNGECSDWLTDLAAHLTPLVHLDLANRLANGGVGTLPDNCTRLMKSQTSCVPCATKIAGQVTSASSKIDQEQIKKAAKALGSKPEEVLRWVRGHLLASAALKYVLSRAKSLGKKVDMSADALYAAAIAHFGKALAHHHPHRDHYLQAAQTAYQTM